MQPRHSAPLPRRRYFARNICEVGSYKSKFRMPVRLEVPRKLFGRLIATEVTGTNRFAEMAPKRRVACANTLDCGLDALGDRHPSAFAVRRRSANVASESCRR